MQSHDISTRFARAHLSTRAERAAYLALVGASTESRTPDELALGTGLEPAEFMGALDRFETAGIAEREEGPDGPRYRIRVEMVDPFQDPDASAAWIDPVCGMPVIVDTPYRATDDLGREQRFCSSVCLAGFLAFPARFTPGLSAAYRALRPTG